MKNVFDPYRARNDLTLGELVAISGEILGHLNVSPADARANARPDQRTVRYYITLGLIDRPLRYEGVSAIYGFRHLLQLVSVKVLQAQFLPLPRIQVYLLGKEIQELEALIEEALMSGSVTARAKNPLDLMVVSYSEIHLIPGVTLKVRSDRAGLMTSEEISTMKRVLEEQVIPWLGRFGE